MTFYGNTIDEALNNAVLATGKQKNELVYEVVSNAAKDEKIVLNVIRYKTKAKLCIKNGSLIYINGELNPEIQPGSNTEIFVNNAKIDGKTYIKDDDIVEIRPVNENELRNYEINITPDKMKAYIRVMYKPLKIYRVMDAEECEVLTVNSELVSERYPEKFKSDEVESKISELKIKYGIDWSNVKKSIDGGEYTIANGLERGIPVDDSITYYFQTDIEKKPVEIDGKVDYYNMGNVQYVDKDFLLAQRVDGCDGTPGYDVFGNILSPLKRHIKKLLKGPGVELLDNGTKAISTAEGMPCIINNRICVYPVLNINNDVDIKTGNVVFDGDIKVTGNIKEGLKVNCGRNASIMGDVTEAQVSSGGNIKIGRNVISSIIKAGVKQLNDENAVNYFKEYQAFIKSLLDIYGRIESTGRLPQNVKTGKVLKLLLDSKFSTCKSKIEEANEFINANQNNETRDFWKKLYSMYILIKNSSINKKESLLKVYDDITDYIDNYSAITFSADITAAYCQNSKLQATNDIIITGKGCYNTSLNAKRNVIFKGLPGIMRGGSITTEGSIKVGEAGSPAGVFTMLKTKGNGVIEADIAYQNTLLCINDYSYEITNPVRKLKAYIQKGEITVEKLKL